MKFYPNTPAPAPAPGQAPPRKKSNAELGAERVLAEMSPGERFLAGMGHGFASVGRGAEQLALKTASALGVRDADVAERKLQAAIDSDRAFDAPLLHGWGRAGDFAGTAAAAAPLMMVPGANTMGGAALAGAGLGLLEPTATGDSRLLNTALGAVGGVAGKAVGDTLGQGMRFLLSRAQARNAVRQAANEARDQAVADTREAGYRLPPSATGGGLIGRAVELAAGTANVAEDMSLKNQANTNRLAREALDIHPDEPMADGLGRARQEAGRVYEDLRYWPGEIWTTPRFRDTLAGLSRMSPDMSRDAPELAEHVGRGDPLQELADGLNQPRFSAGGALDWSRRLRGDAAANLRSGDRQQRTLGLAQRKAAQALEDDVEENIRTAGQPEIAEDFDHARRTLAMAHDVETAMNDRTGDVSARKLSDLRGSGPALGKGLDEAADFSGKFRAPSQDVDGLKPTPLIGDRELIGMPQTHGLSLLPSAARGLLRNDWALRGLATSPSYAPSPLLRAGDRLLDSDAARAAAQSAGTATGLSESEP